MIEVLVWLLVSYGANGYAQAVERFKTEESCQAIRSKLRYGSSNYIQANIYIPAK